MRKSVKTNKCNCLECGTEFMTQTNKFCSIKCRDLNAVKRQAERLIGIEGEDYIVCKWCKMKCVRIYGGHINHFHKGKTTDDYRKEFPGERLSTTKDGMKVAQGFVRYTQSEEGKKELSERAKGDLNPNSKINATEEERKSRSPFSKEFYKKHGFTEEEAKEKVSEFATEALNGRLTETNFEYWLEKTDGDEELAKELYKDRQATFTLEKCIIRHGEIAGTQIWNDRQEKWKNKVFNDIQFIGCGKSKISHNMFSFLTEDKNLYENEKYIKHNNHIHKYDYCDRNSKRIIEFNGDFWHCNPKIYKFDYFHPVKNKTAQEIWDYDVMKIKAAEFYNYEVLTIWEYEYVNFPDETIKKCIQFLNEKTDT